ncbi:MAG: aminoglycoside phosphotransferase family protein [Chloroflexi bacterium]|nr:aminoglycoside phosphotransferase family protein [Chloroflexota bacterium]
MLERPDLSDEKIIACLHDKYALPVVQLTFLPIGADPNSSVYRVVAADDMVYFVKLRRGAFDEMAVTLPKWLSDQGIKQIIPPLATTTGRLWADLENFKVILYPFIEGHDGFAVALSDDNWRDFGAALKRLHTASIPPSLGSRIQPETYPPQGRESVKRSLALAEHDNFDDPVAIKLAAFLKTKRTEILDLVARAERLALILQARTPEFVVCHSDVHAGNILIDRAGVLHIVDWDNPIWAPKERDLMFVGGGQGFMGHTASEEETLFYQSYGQTQIDPVALAYYRYERIVQDIAIYCEQLLLTSEGGDDREQSFGYLVSNFLPNQVLEITYQSDQTVGIW